MIKQAKPETIEKIEQGWEQQQQILFSRNGINSKTGGIGQDLKSNLKLQNTINEIVKSYIPLCARKVELREEKLKIKGGRSLDERSKKIRQEIKEIDTELVHFNRNSLKKLANKGSGVEHECERQGKEPKNMANTVFGTTIKGLINSINSEAVTPIDGLVPPRFTR